MAGVKVKHTIVELQDTNQNDLAYGNNYSANTNIRISNGSVLFSSKRWLLRRTGCEKWMFILFLLMFIALVVVFCLLLGERRRIYGTTTNKEITGAVTKRNLTDIPKEKDEKVCGSSECLATANMFLSSMDLLADPCEDFVQYACGGWLKQNIPEEGGYTTVLKNMEKNTILDYRELLLRDVEDSDPAAVQKAKKFFSLCNDEETITDAGAKPLLEFLNDLGGWPIINSTWTDESWDMNQVLAKIKPIAEPWHGLFVRIYNASGYFKIGPESFPKNNIDVYNYVREGIQLLDPDNDNDAIIEDALEIREVFEKFNKVAHQNRSDRMMMPKGELQTLMPTIDWNLLFTSITSRHVEDDEMLNVLTPNYCVELNSLLESLSNRSIANYLLWRAMETVLPYMDSKFRALRTKYNPSPEADEESKLSPSESCALLTCDLMDDVVTAMVVADKFTKNDTDEIQDLYEDIKVHMEASLNSSTWLDALSKPPTIQLVQETGLQLSIPDDPHNLDAVKDLYTEIEVTQSFFQCALSAARIRNKRFIADKSFFSNKLEVAALNYHGINVVVKAGLIQPPVYSTDYIRAAMYGSLGSTLSHELLHTLTFQMESKTPPWSQESNERMKNITDCIANKTSNYSVGGIQLDGQKYKFEMVCDIAGMKNAFEAYQKWKETTQLEQYRLQFLNHTTDQVFFLSFARNWCSAYTEEALIHTVGTLSRHPPSHFRIWEAISNSVEFSEAFKCPVGSRMNPSKKCRFV